MYLIVIKIVELFVRAFEQLVGSASIPYYIYTHFFFFLGLSQVYTIFNKCIGKVFVNCRYYLILNSTVQRCQTAAKSVSK